MTHRVLILIDVDVKVSLINPPNRRRGAVIYSTMELEELVELTELVERRLGGQVAPPSPKAWRSCPSLERVGTEIAMLPPVQASPV